MKKHQIQHQFGYMAIILLVFVVVSVVISTAAISMSIANFSAVSSFEQGVEAISVAESGAENALIMLIRNPNYVGETITVGTGQAVSTVTGTNPQTIRSVGTVGTKKRTVEIVVDRTSGIVSVTTWREVFN